MAGTQVLYNTEKLQLKRVYYTGTNTLEIGQAVCYDRDRGTQTDVDTNRIGYVEDPAAGNLHRFAGIVQHKRVSTGHVDIAIPMFNAVLNLYTDQNCVAEVTMLSVKAGSNIFGAQDDGIIVAKALQTVDRSTTNGPVQAVVQMPDTEVYGDVLSLTSGRFPSEAIWSDCPVDFLRRNPMAGVLIEEDFNNWVDACRGWATYKDTGCTANQRVDDPKGVLHLLSDGTDNDQTIITSGGNIAGDFVFTDDGPKLWFEARVKTDKIVTQAMIVGLTEEALAGAAAILADAGTLADVDYVGFRQAEAAQAEIDTVHNTESGGGETVVKNIALTMVADTWYKFGMRYDGSTLTYYIDGAALADTVDADAANFPDGQELAILMGIKDHAAATHGLQCDWVRCAQLHAE